MLVSGVIVSVMVSISVSDVTVNRSVVSQSVHWCQSVSVVSSVSVSVSDVTVSVSGTSGGMVTWFNLSRMILDLPSASPAHESNWSGE